LKCLQGAELSRGGAETNWARTKNVDHHVGASSEEYWQMKSGVKKLIRLDEGIVTVSV
jgi:hypothetical protein